MSAVWARLDVAFISVAPTVRLSVPSLERFLSTSVLAFRCLALIIGVFLVLGVL